MLQRVFGCALAALLGVSAFACKHDLDALQSEVGQTAPLRDGGVPKGGRNGGGIGSAGSAGRASAAGTGGSAEPAPSACEPCERLSAPATQLGLRSCCRGATNAECGLTFRDGTLCLPRAVAGQPDTECGSANSGDMKLEGCCRPDGRCGVAATVFGLGCVARDELPANLGGATQSKACTYECEVDADCNMGLSGLRCVENADRDGRYCAVECERNQDCKQLGHVCALTNDVGMDRVLAVCRPPVGSAAPGEFCSAATDCVNGVCLAIQGQTPYCSQLCRNKPDCPAGSAACFQSNIQSPVTQRPQPFSICRK
jgi:hypothetical protein